MQYSCYNSCLGSAIPTSTMQEIIGDQVSSAFRYALSLIFARHDMHS